MNKLLLIPSAAIAAMTPALVCSSCGSTPSPVPDAEKIAEYIFNPTDLTETKTTSDWENTIMSWTKEEWTAEVYYDLFGWFNWPNLYTIGIDKSFKNLYRENIVEIHANINRSEINVNTDDKTIKIDFLGYVSFVFLEDFTNSDGLLVFKKDDYVMLTFELKNFLVQPIEENNELGFLYKYPTDPKPYCIGFFKVRQIDKEFLNYIEYTNTTEWTVTVEGKDAPANSQNYVKQV